MKASSQLELSETHHRADLAGLRGIALLLVLAFHFSIPPFHGGFIGVDVFFVLSGFLICGNTRRSLHRGSFSMSTFYVRRIYRLAPALLITLCATVLTCALTWPISDARDSAYSAAAASLGSSNIFFFARSGYFDSAAMHKPLLHTWSLGVETQFYLVWPPLHSLSHRVHRYAPAALTLAVIVSGLGSAQYFAHIAPDAAFYLPHSRAWEFLAGAAVNFLPVQALVDELPRLSNVLSVAALCALTCAAAVFRSVHVFPGIRAVVPCLATVAFIITPHSKVSKLFLSQRILGVFGDISYSVYLVHWPVLTTWSAMRGYSALSAWERAGSLLVSLVLGTFLHVAVEKPGMAQRKVPSPRNFLRTTFISLLSVAFAFVLLGGYLNGRIVVSEREAYEMLEKGKLSTMLYGGVVASKVVQLARWTHLAKKGKLSVKAKSYGKSWIFKGRKNGPRVLFMGDSHSEHLQSIGVLLNKRYGANVQFWKGGSCPPLFFVRRVFRYSERKESNCRELNEVWRAKLKQEHFHTVVLAARWSVLTNRNLNDFLISLNETKKIALERKPNELIFKSRSLFQSSLNSTVWDVAANSLNVVIFSQVVMPHTDSKTCKLDRSCTGFSQSIARRRTRFLDNAVALVARGSKRFQAVLPSSYLCPDVDTESRYWTKSETQCIIRIGRSGLYKDDNHLNILGSSYVARKWEKENFGGIKWD